MKDTSSAGFSYIDVMIAIVILMVGILALMSGMSGAVLMSKGQENQLNAKQIAASTMESIMSAKETDQNRPAPLVLRLGWDAIGNVGSNIDPVSGLPQGIFVTGVQPVRTDAGPDEIIGTGDDNGAQVAGLTREIVITDQCDPDRPSPNCPTPGTSAVRIRSVAVTIRYYVGQIRRQEVLTTVLTDYAVAE